MKEVNLTRAAAVPVPIIATCPTDLGTALLRIGGSRVNNERDIFATAGETKDDQSRRYTQRADWVLDYHTLVSFIMVVSWRIV